MITGEPLSRRALKSHLQTRRSLHHHREIAARGEGEGRGPDACNNLHSRAVKLCPIDMLEH